MKLTAITCTYQRPAALELCRRYMARQTRKPDQWLILDGPEPMQQKILAAIEGGKIEGDAVVFFEDDDHYKPGWIAWCEKHIARGYDLVGEGMAVYYNVRYRWWSECSNGHHAALCQTACNRDFLETFANCIRSFDSAFIDTRIWQVECSKYLFMPRTPEERQVHGIKGIVGANGATGYSSEHRDAMPRGVHADPSLMQLFRWIGDDASNYSQFKAK